MSQSLPPYGKKPIEKTSDVRQWYKKKRWIIPIGLVMASSVINSLSIGQVSTNNSSSESVDTPSTSTVMPDLNGAISRDAESELEQLGFLEISHQDASYEDRMILDRDNWFICETRPEPGVMVSFEQTIVLLSVKNNEVCPSNGSNLGETDDEDNSQVEGSSASSSVFGNLTPAQIEVVEVIDSYKVIYENADTDLRKGNARLDRDEAICSIIGNGKVSAWSGVVEEVGSTSEALGSIKIAIGENVTLETWNNEFSDAFDNTLISRKSPLYEILLDLKKGEIVTFSGTFIDGDGACLDTKNLTEYYAVNRPEFIFKFTAIERKP